MPNNTATYTAFYNLWLKDNPPFISDLHKLVMRNIILAAINTDTKSIAELGTFFKEGNEAAVSKFLSYMRKRIEILPEKKAIWRTVAE